jgi:mannan endo-1,4-beta-mannosidase
MKIDTVVNDIIGQPGEWRFVRVVVLLFAIAAAGRMIPLHRRRANQPRRRARNRLVIPAAVLTVVMLAIGGCAYDFTHQPDSGRVIQASARPAATNAEVGVFEPSDTESYNLVSEFMKATGANPAFVLYYSGWDDPFQVRFATWAHAAGAVPFAQLEPNGVQLENIALGHYDAYLRSFARAVHSYGHQIILGFAPEMNGSWYTWGLGHTRASVWIAAWRHVVTVFRKVGAANVTWLWTVNSVNASSAPLHKWWPGANYVSWVGIDGYYYRASDTFASVFGTTIQEVRRFTYAPILIAETAAAPSPEQAGQITGLFAGIRASHLRGAVWFDMAQHDGPYHQDWRLEDSPSALAVFRRAAEGS